MKIFNHLLALLVITFAISVVTSCNRGADDVIVVNSMEDSISLSMRPLTIPSTIMMPHRGNVWKHIMEIPLVSCSSPHCQKVLLP